MQVGQTKIKWFYKGLETKCVILAPNDKILAESIIKRFHSDVPDKKYARAKTFKNAMRRIAFKNRIPKEERTQIWSTFRETINQPLKPVN